MLVHVLQCSEMLRELFLRRWKIDWSKNLFRATRGEKKNLGRYAPLHSDPGDLRTPLNKHKQKM